MDEEPQKQSAQDEQIERSAWKMSFIIYPHIMYIIYYIYIMCIYVRYSHSQHPTVRTMCQTPATEIGWRS